MDNLVFLESDIEHESQSVSQDSHASVNIPDNDKLIVKIIYNGGFSSDNPVSN